MKVRAVITLLFLAVGGVLAAGLLLLRQADRQRAGELARDREALWKVSVAAFLAQQSAPVTTMVEHLSALERTLPALLDGDAAWAREHWDERTLATYGANFLWVCRADGTVFHSASNVDGKEPRPLPFPAGAFAAEGPRLFHAAAPHDVFADLEFIEVHRAPIRPAADAEGRSTPLGWFIAGRLWDEEKLQELPRISPDDTIELRPPGAAAATADPARMIFVKPLADWRGEPFAELVVANHSPALAALAAQGRETFMAFLAGALGLLALLFLLLARSIVRPLHAVIRGLNDEDLAPLRTLSQSRSEFGELARLITLFFQQRTALARETQERAGAQAALQRSEEMLQHSQRMEAIGRLAGGVAHDFNNLLTAIIGYAALLAERVKGDPTARQEAQLIHQAGEQAAGLTRQLLAFSRKQLLQPRVVDLNAIVTRLHMLLQRILGEHIEIAAALAPGLGRVRADPGQLEQVIVNLSVNARDAMPRGGRLTIRTADVVLNGEAELPAGNYVALEVTDAGEGMDAETQRRVFEPFFTTKGPGQGTGLGLATVYGIVRQSGGGVTVESAPGRGTTFRVYLPREMAPLEVEESASAKAESGSRCERILFVEDDELVRELVSEILKGEGYELHAARSGAEALERARACGGRIDLLISDVVMPQMNGPAVAQAVRLLSPRARVLFISGYSENDMADLGLDGAAFEVLQKPFTPTALVGKVREVLDRATDREEKV